MCLISCTPRPLKQSGNQAGFSIIEVMISAAIAAIALLSLGAAQLKALQYATSSFQYTVGVIQANNAAERLWSELCDVSVSGEYDQALFDTLAPSSSGYTITLPNTFDTDFNIQITWTDERLDAGNSASVQIFPQYPNLDASHC